MFASPQLPSAALHERSAWRRLLLRLKQPPLWAARPGRWAISGGVAAVVAHLLSLAVWMLIRGDLRWLDLTSARNVYSLLVVGFSALVSGFFVAAPFAVASTAYFALVGRRTPWNGALWNTAFHTIAHVLLLLFLGVPLVAQLHVPILIGFLWGLWLPRTRDHEGDLPYGTRRGNRLCE